MWWRKLLTKLFGGKVVVLEDFDGEYNFRIARRSPFGKWYAYRYRVVCLRVILNEDKTISGPHFVVRWSEV